LKQFPINFHIKSKCCSIFTHDSRMHRAS